MIRWILFVLPLLLFSETYSQLRFGTEFHDSAIYSKSSVSGVLYAGIENELALHLNYPDDSVLLLANNGTIFYDDGFVVIPQRTGKERIEIFLQTKNKKEYLGYKSFEVLSVPEPILQIDTIKLADNKLMLSEIFIMSDCLNVFISHDIIDSDKWYTVQEFTMSYSFGSYNVSKNNIGNRLNIETRQMIRNLSSNRTIAISAIIKSKTDVVKLMPLIKITLY